MLRLLPKPDAVRAIDTNVIVRALIGDDLHQEEVAWAVINAGGIFIGTTVVLEAEWVLRSAYRLGSSEIAANLRRLFGLPGITLEEPREVGLALDWMDEAVDFADALHVARSSHCGSFVTFDHKLSRRVAGLTAVPIELVK